jgi:hypothetical protein
MLKSDGLWSLFMRDEVQDRYGNKIYLTDERWKHIIKGHRQLNGHRAEILKTVRLGKRTQDVVLPFKFYYNYPFQFLAPFQEMEVVVVFRWRKNQPNNFIVTAYPV